MNLSELQKKDIINMETGYNLGRIVDVEINLEGKILRLSTEPKKFMKKFIRSADNIIEFSSIVKIGTDVILVK